MYESIIKTVSVYILVLPLNKVCFITDDSFALSSKLSFRLSFLPRLMKPESSYLFLIILFSILHSDRSSF